MFPQADLERVKQQLARLADAERDGIWFIKAANSDSIAIWVRIETTADEPAPLYCDWEASVVQGLRAAIGRIPTWCATCDISGRIPGDTEVRTLVLELLAEGGVVLDDYSDHYWTAAEIVEDRDVDGLGFFDYRTSFERSHDPEH